jgi:hypothetical protein
MWEIQMDLILLLLKNYQLMIKLTVRLKNILYNKYLKNNNNIIIIIQHKKIKIY